MKTIVSKFIPRMRQINIEMVLWYKRIGIYIYLDVYVGVYHQQFEQVTRFWWYAALEYGANYFMCATSPCITCLSVCLLQTEKGVLEWYMAYIYKLFLTKTLANCI